MTKWQISRLFADSVIVDKIDANGDGEVSEQELIDWIKKAQNKYMEEEVQRQWEVSAVSTLPPHLILTQ